MGRIPGFIGGAYTLQSVNIDAQRCVNLFPQITESMGQADGEKGALITAPGTRLLGTCGTGPIRGMYVTSTGGFVIVSGAEVYRVGLNWVFTKIGDILTKSGRVSMADNGTQLCIVDGAHGYIVSLSTATLTQITSAGFPGGNTVIFNGSYFLVNNPGTNQFAFSSSWDGLIWNALDFISAEANPDAVVGIIDFKNNIAVQGQKTVEFYWNSGADTTYSRIDGSLVEYGCIAPQTAAKVANTLMWVGGGATGQGVVWQSEGYVPRRVSNHGVELAIQGYGDIGSATAWVYQENGHAFYVLNFPSADTSWVYDISTGLWHERAYLGLDGNFQRHRAECYAYGFDTHVVGDYENGNIYALENTTYSDNGRPRKWVRRFPHLSANGKRVFYDALQLMATVGQGLDGLPANGADPQVELRYSDDFGHTWSTPRAMSLGRLGEYAKRVIWRQLGQSRNRVFEVSGSDPVFVTLNGAELTARPGVS